MTWKISWTLVAEAQMRWENGYIPTFQQGPQTSLNLWDEEFIYDCLLDKS